MPETAQTIYQRTAPEDPSPSYHFDVTVTQSYAIWNLIDHGRAGRSVALNETGECVTLRTGNWIDYANPSRGGSARGARLYASDVQAEMERVQKMHRDGELADDEDDED